MDEKITEMITPEESLDVENIQADETLAPEETAPVVQAPEAQAVKAPEAPKPKKKLNKKLLIAGIAVVLVAALVIGLLAILGGGTKSTGVFIKDGELYLYVQGKKEPIELTDRLWKDADDNSDFVSKGSLFTGYTTVRGNLVFFPDKYSGDVTLYVKNINKADDDAEKIGSNISSYYVTEDGKQMIFVKDGDLYLYDVKNMEDTRIAQDITNGRVGYAEDLSKICYLSNGDAYLWTPKTEDVKIAKDIASFHYIPKTDLFFGLTADGELMMKTSDMEEAEEIADKVVSIKAVYPTGEIFYTRSSTVERTLLDYLDDDMLAEDAAITKPQKPNYPTAPKKIYSWNFTSDAEYQAAKEQYDLDYAAYQEQYNAMKEEYNNALELYNQKADRDYIRDSLADRNVKYTEYALYCYDGSDEHLLTDTLADGNVSAVSGNVAVMVYRAYTPTELIKPKMSEMLSNWEAPYIIQDAITNALYSESEFYVAVGTKASVIETTDASNFLVTADGSSVYFLDAPFVAYSNKKGSTAAPAVETAAPAMEAPAATEAPAAEETGKEDTLIPADQREYASLYCVSIEDGKPGQATLVDSEISIEFNPRIGYDPSRLVYAKAVDSKDRTGEFYVDGQLICDEASLFRYTWMEDSVLFYTDWDTEDGCGTLCMMKLGNNKAEIIEIADDVSKAVITENNDLLYLQDYNKKRYEGTLYLYDVSKGKSVEIADDVIYLG